MTLQAKCQSSNCARLIHCDDDTISSTGASSTTSNSTETTCYACTNNDCIHRELNLSTNWGVPSTSSDISSSTNSNLTPNSSSSYRSSASSNSSEEYVDIVPELGRSKYKNPYKMIKSKYSFFKNKGKYKSRDSIAKSDDDSETGFGMTNTNNRTRMRAVKSKNSFLSKIKNATNKNYDPKFRDATANDAEHSKIRTKRNYPFKTRNTINKNVNSEDGDAMTQYGRSRIKEGSSKNNHPFKNRNTDKNATSKRGGAESTFRDTNGKNYPHNYTDSKTGDTTRKNYNEFNKDNTAKNNTPFKTTISNKTGNKSITVDDRSKKIVMYKPTDVVAQTKHMVFRANSNVSYPVVSVKTNKLKKGGKLLIRPKPRVGFEEEPEVWYMQDVPSKRGISQYLSLWLCDIVRCCVIPKADNSNTNNAIKDT